MEGCYIFDLAGLKVFDHLTCEYNKAVRKQVSFQ